MDARQFRMQYQGTQADEEAPMPDHVYKIVDIVGSSETSIEEAIGNAVTRASKTLRNLRWFEVMQTRGEIKDGKVHFFQVQIRVGFTME
jgi:flavin-binding protein dodecin